MSSFFKIIYIGYIPRSGITESIDTYFLELLIHIEVLLSENGLLM